MKSLLPAVLIALLVSFPAPARGCAVAGRDGEHIDITEETAIIVWDEANQTEHFIRRASFESTAYDFGFLVPTPSPPEVEESDDEVFSRLADITKPKIEHRKMTAVMGCVMMNSKFAASDAGSNEGVVVLQQKRVGDHDVVSIKFDPKAGSVQQGSRALAEWLVRFGYGFGDALQEWVTPYVKNYWVITAFRIAGEPNATVEPKPGSTGKGGDRSPRGPNTLRAKPVRLSFKTNRPFYPYREPADRREGNDSRTPRMLKVYFAADRRYSGTLGEGTANWPGCTVWADKLQDGERTDVIAKAKLPATAGPSQWTVTEFEDRSSPRLGTDEVYFAPSADQSPVARPPIVIWEESFTAWYVALGICLGLPLITYAVIALKRRKR